MALFEDGLRSMQDAASNVWRRGTAPAPKFLLDPVNPNVAKGVLSAEAAASMPVTSRSSLSGYQTPPPTVPEAAPRFGPATGGPPEPAGLRAPGSIPAGGSPEAQAYRAVQAAETGPRLPPGGVQSAPEPIAAAGPETRLGRAAFSTGKALGTASRLAGGLATTAPLAGFGDYKIDDPGVDSSLGGVAKNVVSGNFSAAGQGLRKGAVEAGLDSISGLAKTGDFVGNLVGQDFGLARSFDSKVRSDLGGFLPPKAVPAGAPAATSSGVQTNVPGYNQAADSQAASNPTLGSTAGAPTPAAEPDWRTVNSAPPKTGAAVNTIYDFRDADGKRQLVGNGGPVTKDTIFGDPNSEYNRQVRSGEIADRYGTVHTQPQGAAAPAEDNGVRATRAQLTAQLNDAMGRLTTGMATPSQRAALSHIAGTAMAGLTQLEGAQLGLRGTQYTSDNTLIGNKLSRDAELRKLQIEQFNKDRDFGLSSQREAREGTTANVNNYNSANNELTKQIESMNPGQDGKPDPTAVARQLDGFQRALGSLGGNASKMSDLDRTRLVAAAHLHDFVTQNATNWPVPWRPDYPKTDNPVDYLGMTRDKNGNGILRNGKGVIPARFLEKQNADYIGGAPTTRYEPLFAK